MLEAEDWLGFVLDLPMRTAPGSTFAYCSGGSHLLSGINRFTIELAFEDRRLRARVRDRAGFFDEKLDGEWRP